MKVIYTYAKITGGTLLAPIIPPTNETIKVGTQVSMYAQWTRVLYI